MFDKSLLKNVLIDQDRLHNVIDMFNSEKINFSFKSVLVECCSSVYMDFYYGNYATQGSCFQGQV